LSLGRQEGLAGLERWLDMTNTADTKDRRRRWRLAMVIATVASIWAAFALVVRALPIAQGSAILHIAVAALLGAVAMLLACSLVEWLVHGRLMHRRSRWPLVHLAYDLHHRAHHWIHYPPDAYVQDEVTYVPLVPPRPERACRTATETAFAALGQAFFYASFSLPLVVLAWLTTGDAAFVASAGLVATVFVALAVHVHDAVHCPGWSPLERFRWFWALDRHHYLHHVDTRANVNFLLPLGDLMLGTLRTQMTPAEAARWPSYEVARARVLPSCRRRQSTFFMNESPRRNHRCKKKNRTTSGTVVRNDAAIR
jgi:sterol desaturase/sphingolipid hydroxylase (fatty acid hydroxylase superfamily)